MLIPPIIFFAVPLTLASYRIYTYLFPSSPPNTYDPTTGLGRGAPGFQTGSRKVSLPLHIAARIRLGEEVTADEVTEALALERERLEREERDEEERRERERRGVKTMKVPETVDEEWLPKGATVIGGQKGAGGARRRKK